MVVILTGPESGPTTALGTATIRNDSQFNRQGMVEWNHPVALGAVRPGDPITITEDGSYVRADWSPHGDLYPDGSAKRVRVNYRTTMAALTTRTVEVSKSSSGVVPGSFTYPAHFLSDFELALFHHTQAANGALVFNAQNPFSVRRGNGGNSEVWTWYGRIPNTPMWAELEVEPIHGMQHAHFTLWTGHHDITQTRNEFTPTGNGIAFRMRRGEPLVRWQGLKVSWIFGPRYQTGYDPSLFASGFIGRLVPGNQKIGHGQSTCIKGVIQFSDPDPAAGSLLLRTILAEQERPMTAISDEWVNFPELYMPCGQIAQRPAHIAQSANLDVVVALQEGHSPGANPFFFPLIGQAPDCNRAGDQQDFRASFGSALIREGDPRLLHAMQRDAYQEACRPQNFREADPSLPIRSAARPNLINWRSQPFCNDPNDPGRQSPEQLGRIPCYSPDINGARAPFGSGSLPWDGRRRQHYSMNVINAYAMLTGDRWATRWLDTVADNWLQDMIDPSNTSLSVFAAGVDSPRGIGRPYQSLCQVYFNTGRADVRARLSRRLDGLIQNVPTIQGNTPVSALYVRGPEVGNIMVGDYYSPWEDGIAIGGIWQAAEVTGHTAIIPYVKRIARSQVMNSGWLEVSPGYWLVAKAVFWNNGQILTQQQLQNRGDPTDPNTTNPYGHNPQSVWNGGFGTDYNWWACAAPILGRMWAIQDNDSAWQARCEAIIESLQNELTAIGNAIGGRWPNLEEKSITWEEFAAIGPVDTMRLSL